MSDTPACPHCGAARPASELAGLCPACLLRLAMGEADDDGQDGEALEAVDTPTARPLSATYRVLTLLAGDNSRTTYLAEDHAAHRLVTLDVVRLPSGDAATRRAVNGRIEALLGLDHPAIPKTLSGGFTTPTEAFVATAYVSGRRIDRLGAGARLDGAAAFRMFERVCDAVASAHRRGVSHGRLGSDSVIVRKVGGVLEPMVTGFSLVAGSLPTPAQDVDGLVRVARSLGWSGDWPEGDASVAALRSAVGRSQSSMS